MEDSVATKRSQIKQQTNTAGRVTCRFKIHLVHCCVELLIQSAYEQSPLHHSRFNSIVMEGW